MPIIFIFSLTCNVYKDKYNEKIFSALKLDAKFRDELKLYYESNDVDAAYEKLCVKCKDIFLEFKKIYQTNYLA